MEETENSRAGQVVPVEVVRADQVVSVEAVRAENSVTTAHISRNVAAAKLFAYYINPLIYVVFSFAYFTIAL